MLWRGGIPRQVHSPYSTLVWWEADSKIHFLWLLLISGHHEAEGSQGTMKELDVHPHICMFSRKLFIATLMNLSHTSFKEYQNVVVNMHSHKSHFENPRHAPLRRRENKNDPNPPPAPCHSAEPSCLGSTLFGPPGGVRIHG